MARTSSKYSTTARQPPMSCIRGRSIFSKRSSFLMMEGSRFVRCATTGSPDENRRTLLRSMICTLLSGMHERTASC